MRNLIKLLAVGGHWLMYGFVREPGAELAMRLTVRDLDTIQSQGLRLVREQTGYDRLRSSAWFLFERFAAPLPDPTLSRSAV